MINIDEKDLRVIKKIIAEYIPAIEVRAFGSRLNGVCKPYSDLDLAVVGSKRIDSQIWIKLKDAFHESDLPFRVDIIDWHNISDEFKNVVEKKYEVLTC